MRGVIRLAIASAIAALLAAGVAVPAAADSGWRITAFETAVDVRGDGSLQVTETIWASFSTARHGIYRDIPVRYDHDAHSYRVLDIAVTAVTDGAGRSWRYAGGRSGSLYRLKIGDPGRTVSGPQTYVIAYVVRGALNSFSDHDELYWNATGNSWGVPIDQASAKVVVRGLQRATCFQGPSGSTAPCANATSWEGATYRATAPLSPGEGLTVVAAMARGAVSVPPPILEPKPRDLAEMFELNAATLGLSGLLAALGLAGVALLWWRHGRDHVYRTAYYTNHDPATPDEIMPIGDHRPIAVELEPPDGLRPGQLGLILDESADTRDVTATIIDLAARGHLSIQELAGQGVFGRPDYLLRQGNTDVSRLQVYERTLWYAIFASRQEIRLSELKGTFAPALKKAESELYRDAVTRRWFLRNPATERALWLGLGIVVSVAGFGVAIVLGQLAGGGLIGLAIAIVGLAIVVSHRRFPHRTAAGRDLFQRTLGFRMYMTTAERYMQQFAEREKVFTAYLPYAIVFGCVDRWAHAFQGIDLERATAGWYSGPSYANALLFSASLQGFSNTVGSAIAYSPAPSGGSGFGGGSGGGFGGGGGGSW